MSANVIKVFISYAHESPAFRDSIKELAIWLNTAGKGKISVTTDHKHENRAPPMGWQVWMENQVEESDIVLVVCTPLYVSRYSKKQAVGGSGVTFEGAIITQSLYDANQINEKFHPIIPDDGKADNVPKMLKPFFNHLKFPSQNKNILSCILDENPSLEPEDVPSEDDGVLIINLSDSIINLENEIVSEITTNQKQPMLASIHILVRGFLSLSDPQKILIATKLSVISSSIKTLLPADRDKEIFKLVKEKNAMHDLWDEVNKLKPFTELNNPF